jgi:hypothetical protein
MSPRLELNAAAKSTQPRHRARVSRAAGAGLSCRWQISTQEVKTQ